MARLGAHGAGHPYADSHNQSKSAVISRDWTVDANLSLGTETYLPSRLLWGVLPATLLESHEFWQDEDDNVRGYPRDENASTDVIYIRLGVGAHVAFHGARFDRVRVGGESLPPTRARVLRLKKSRLSAQRDATMAAIRALEDFTREKGLLSEPFTANFMVCKALAAILRRLAGHSFGQAASAAAGKTAAKKKKAEAEVALAGQLEDLLHQVELTPFARRRKRHRLSHIVLPALLDSVATLVDEQAAADAAAAAAFAANEPKSPSRPLFGLPDPEKDADGTAATTPTLPPSAAASHTPTAAAAAPAPTAAASGGGAASASDLEEEELVLLDLLHAPRGSYLYHLANVLVRVENLSHILAWARFDESKDLTKPLALSQADLRVVTLPRLKLTFLARAVPSTRGEVVRLYSVDHADLYITNERNTMITELLAGLPTSLLLSNSNGEMSVLVPSVPPCRPAIATVPFSTELVMHRSDKTWYAALENPYYIYPVHVSLSFLYSTTLASALYLMLMRYLNRQYHQVVRLVDTVASDTDLTLEENNSLQFMTSSKVSRDCHPDAHACRLKISLVMLDSPVALPWDLSVEMGAYVRKLQHVSADCKLSEGEELTLLKHCVCDPADRRFDPEVHTPYGVFLCKNRRSALRAAAPGRQIGAGATCAVELPPRPSDRRWIYEWHDNVLTHTAEQLNTLLEELAMKFSPQRGLQLDGLLSLLATVNAKSALPVGISIATGGFLLLYNLFNGQTEAKVVSTNCSVSFATLLLPFYPELREPSLLGSLLLALARRPLLGPFLPEFTDNRRYKRRDVFTGTPLPDEAEAPLGVLIANCLRELHELGGANGRKHDEVSSKMLTRRVEALTRRDVGRRRLGRRFGGGFGGWGGGGWGGGGGNNSAAAAGGGTSGWRRWRRRPRRSARPSCASSPTGRASSAPRRRTRRGPSARRSSRCRAAGCGCRR